MKRMYWLPIVWTLLTCPLLIFADNARNALFGPRSLYAEMVLDSETVTIRGMKRKQTVWGVNLMLEAKFMDGKWMNIKTNAGAAGGATFNFLNVNAEVLKKGATYHVEKDKLYAVILYPKTAPMPTTWNGKPAVEAVFKFMVVQ